MKIKLELNDFNVQAIDQQNCATGGQSNTPSFSGYCTDGDVGCCDEGHVDDCYTSMQSSGYGSR